MASGVPMRSSQCGSSAAAKSAAVLNRDRESGASARSTTRSRPALTSGRRSRTPARRPERIAAKTSAGLEPWNGRSLVRSSKSTTAVAHRSTAWVTSPPVASGDK